MERLLLGLLGVALFVVGVAWFILERVARRMFPPHTIVVVERQGPRPIGYEESWLRVILGLMAIGVIIAVFHPR